MKKLFKPGQSGNPKGRPPDSELQRKLKARILDESPALIEIAIEKAKQDFRYMDLLLSKVLPGLRAEEIKVQEPDRVVKMTFTINGAKE